MVGGFVKLNKPQDPQPFYFGESNVPFYLLGSNTNKKLTKMTKKRKTVKTNKVDVDYKNPLQKAQRVLY
jgi:hypothetical protein